MNLNIQKTKWLIPALALLIILESVIVVNRLQLKTGSVKERFSLPEQINEVQEPAIISLEGDNQINAEEEESLKVILTALKTINLDGVDIYLKYDPDVIEIIGADPANKFSFVGRNWVEPEKERVLISMVETDALEGVVFEAGSQTNLATINLVGLTAGQTKIEVFAPAGSEGTVLAGGGEEFSFTKEDLVLNIE
jgi:hypothetical protein